MDRILVVDDEIDICEILKFNLENNGYAVDVANSGKEALNMPLAGYNLLLLDVMMDDMSGFALAARIRQDAALKRTPIIFITAKTGENDLLTGFNVGADDYICKPFRISEVIARVKAVIRRNAKRVVTEVSNSNITFNGLELNVETKRAYVDGMDISLTKKEFEVLCMLMTRPGRVYSREEILARVWPDDVNVLERSIDVNMARLRKKLGEYANNVVSRSGYGYCFVNE
ncbi:MAG: response regulator transcription factor [Bacteroidaceae bacterium]|nr:response regulator transcription factor [Bacteroidaceae bacterium]